MKSIWGCIAIASAVAFSTPVYAGGYCGAAGYRCCPQSACQPTACYSTCKIERQTCYRTVYDTVYEPQQYTCYRTVYDTVYENRLVTLLQASARNALPRDQVHCLPPGRRNVLPRAELHSDETRLGNQRTNMLVSSAQTRVADL